MQLDTRVKLGIRDSLFRLAKSAMERQSASDRSSTNKINREDDEVAANIDGNGQDRFVYTTFIFCFLATLNASEAMQHHFSYGLFSSYIHHHKSWNLSDMQF